MDNDDPFFPVITPANRHRRQWPGHPTGVQLSLVRVYRPPWKTICTTDTELIISSAGEDRVSVVPTWVRERPRGASIA